MQIKLTASIALKDSEAPNLIWWELWIQSGEDVTDRQTGVTHLIRRRNTVNTLHLNWGSGKVTTKFLSFYKV